MSKLKFLPLIMVLGGISFGAVACDSGDSTDDTDTGTETETETETESASE